MAQVLHLHRLTGEIEGPVPAWRRQAACRGLDPAVFHPDDEESAAVDAAVAVCSGCPVREPCLEHAIAAREPDGVWGGLTARQRRRVIRRRRRSA